MKRDVAGGLLCVLLCLGVLVPMLIPGNSWPAQARDMLSREGYASTGAPNLVAAIYLGYRAYDTLGETVVLLAALAAAMGLIKGAEKRAPAPVIAEGEGQERSGPGRSGPGRSGEKKRSHEQRHTDIIDITAGKLSPILLLFGWYVMFYGHQSPGGGFQGGVVLASGIIFIALGRREGGVGRLDKHHAKLGGRSLQWLELVSFVMILILCFAGMSSGASLLGNPIKDTSPLPRVAYVVAFNLSIGLKVGSGTALVCLLMMGEGDD